MFRTSSRSLWQLASRSSSARTTLPRASIAPLLRQQRAAYSSKSDQENPPPPKQPIDYEAERKRGQELLQSDPSHVSVESSVANNSGEPRGASGEAPMGNELKHDLNVVKDTFTFTDVPQESRILGLAGTLPYLGTSLSTVFLAWDLNKPIPSGNAFYDAIMIDHETAKQLLSALEPVQLGYGAVIISFLGAIHWGLEYAEKQPLRERTRFRYGMGLASSIVAWPTLMLPIEYALTTQFMAFVGLYFADSRAATKGWAPRWYGSYRFLLTAMVGFSIFISLIGRAKIKQGDAITAKGLSDNFSRAGIADHDTNWEKLEAKEKARRHKEEKEREEKEAKEAKEAEKKKKEEEKKGKKRDGKGGDKAKKGDDKAKASEEGGDKKGDEKSENKDKDAEKSESKETDGKDEAKDEGKEEKESKDESEDESKDKEKSEEESSDKESKEDSEKKEKSDDKKDESKDEKKEKSDKKEEGDKENKSEGKENDKSKDKKKNE